VQLDNAKIVAAVADALLWTGGAGLYLSLTARLLSERPVPFAGRRS